MDLWLLFKAKSMTSWLALFGGLFVIFVLAWRRIDKKKVGVYAVTAASLILVAQMAFDITGTIADLRGKEDTYEGRGRLWAALLSSGTNPLIGVGFESYWLGDRQQWLENLPGRDFLVPNEAHNGYLEIYLNLGIVGLALLLCMLYEAHRKCRQDLLEDFPLGQLRYGAFLAVLMYNWPESAFKGLHLVYLFFFVMSINYRFVAPPHHSFPLRRASARVGVSRRELAYK
jgi:O-antigen ligase